MHPRLYDAYLDSKMESLEDFFSYYNIQGLYDNYNTNYTIEYTKSTRVFTFSYYNAFLVEDNGARTKREIPRDVLYRCIDEIISDLLQNGITDSYLHVLLDKDYLPEARWSMVGSYL